MTTIRAFIAVELPDPVKDALSDVAQALARRVPRDAIRWVRPEQMHLTLRFLGDTAVDQLPAVQSVMDGVAGGHSSFFMRLNGTGCFPNARRPRVIWVGLAGDEARLHALKAALDERLAPLGWPPEGKSFRAHLTLGRVKDEHGLRDVEWSAAVRPLEVPVVAIHLIESQLRPSGPIYTTRYTSRFPV